MQLAQRRNQRVYNTIDKSGWSAGPWQDEPDKMQWIDEETGLDCLIKRQNRSGHLCGYVGVPPGHPLHGLDWSDVVHDLHVHGGITYTEACSDGDEADSICHVPEPGRPDNVWWLGFDCIHHGDMSPTRQGDGGHYRTFAYVYRECVSLAKQLAEIAGR